MDDWDKFQEKRQKSNATYYSSEEFLEDMRKGELMDGFFLDEGVFQELVGLVSVNQGIAKEMNDNAIMMALKCDGSQELGGILEVAEVCANGG